jgi:hypothetical protein
MTADQKVERLSPTMREACATAHARGDGKLYRHPHGLWTPIGRCPHTSMSECMRGGHFSTNTVEALVERGAAVVSHWAKRKSDGQTFATEISIKPLTELEGR